MNIRLSAGNNFTNFISAFNLIKNMSSLSNQEFYNEFAAFYDGMINFKSSLERKKFLLKSFINENYKTAADIGCGTGLDSIALVMNELSVTAFDPSPQMINHARSNAESFGYKINFINSGADRIDNEFINKFDIAISLGNAIANIPTDILILTIDNIYKMLTSGGTFLLQILNYDLILSKEERIVNITRADDNFFVRFYDFEWDLLRFNILVFNEKETRQHRLISTQIFPHSKSDILNILEECGFKNIEVFGSLDKTFYDDSNSKDLVISAVKHVELSEPSVPSDLSANNNNR